MFEMNGFDGLFVKKNVWKANYYTIICCSLLWFYYLKILTNECRIRIKLILIDKNRI